MSLLLGVDLGGVISSTFVGDIMTLRRVVETADPASPAGAPTTTTTDYPCRGYTQSTQSLRFDEGVVRAETVAFGIYGDSVAVKPRKDDVVVTTEGTHKVYLVDGDSVRGVWVLLTYLVSP